jgi:membrane protease YdiL (CAAX protease family)
VFLGPEGLRPGWRFVLYLVAFFAVFFALGFVTQLFLHRRSRQPISLWLGLISEFELLIAAIVPAIVAAKWERRPFGAYGLPKTGAFGRLFWIGAIWGFVGITALLLVMRGIHIFYFGAFALHGLRILKFAAFWGLLFLLVGLFEEFVTRGYTQFTLSQAIGFWPTALVLSAVFGAIHLGNKGEAAVGALGAACIGLFFCLTLWRTGTLWFAVGMHMAWDWGETFFYSVPDSGLVAPGHLLNSSFHGPQWLTGGSVGPEGSVLVFVIIGLLWLVFHFSFPEVRWGIAEKIGPPDPSAV